MLNDDDDERGNGAIALCLSGLYQTKAYKNYNFEHVKGHYFQKLKPRERVMFMTTFSWKDFMGELRMQMLHFQIIFRR